MGTMPSVWKYRRKASRVELYKYALELFKENPDKLWVTVRGEIFSRY